MGRAMLSEVNCEIPDHRARKIGPLNCLPERKAGRDHLKHDGVKEKQSERDGNQPGS